MEDKVTKIGLFVNGIVTIEYPYDGDMETYMEAIEDCKFATQETGIFHELKLFVD